MAKIDKNLSNTNSATEALKKVASEFSQDSNPSNPIWRKQLKKGLGILGALAFVVLLVASIFIFGKYYDTACQVSMIVELNGKKMEDNGVYNVTPGDIITVEASSSEAAIAFIGYYFSSIDEDNIENTQRVDSSKIEITVPSVAQDTTLILSIEAVAENDNGKDNTTTKTGWKNAVWRFPKLMMNIWTHFALLRLRLSWRTVKSWFLPWIIPSICWPEISGQDLDTMVRIPTHMV